MASVGSAARLPTPVDSVPMSVADAEQVAGEGWLLCAGAVAAGVAAASTLIGAGIGSLAVVCGCADYLDAAFDTDFTEICELGGSPEAQ